MDEDKKAQMETKSKGLTAVEDIQSIEEYGVGTNASRDILLMAIAKSLVEISASLKELKSGR